MAPRGKYLLKILKTNTIDHHHHRIIIGCIPSKITYFLIQTCITCNFLMKLIFHVGEALSQESQVPRWNWGFGVLLFHIFSTNKTLET